MNKRANQKLIATKFAEFRHSLAYIDALPQLTLLGMLVGLITGGIIVVFRLLIETPLLFLIPGHPDNFEALPLSERALLITSGVGLLMLMMHFVSAKDRETSVSHVLDRMHNHQAKLPLKNWWVQFIGAIVCMVSGQSAGREGPVAHLGAGAASQLGQWMRLPNNSNHTLVGCGVAAAISASFDTPMAGVIFAMEVLAMEYTIVGFVPVILASVVGTIVSKAAFEESAFIITGDISLQSLYEIPFLLCVGLCISLCAGVYIRFNILMLKLKSTPITVRLAAAGVLTIAAASAVPQVMGHGYDTVNSALSGSLLLGSLVVIGLVKLLLTPVVIGLGIPGGLVGPTLVIGACIGGALGLITVTLFPDLNAHPGLYVLMGMTGMMAAVLNAPLTALVTVLELTYNSNIIFPAMLVIVVACVSTRQIFRVNGIFIEQLIHSKRPLDFGPAKQALHRAGVRSVMDTRFIVTPQYIDPTQARIQLLNHPMWLVIENQDGRYAHAMRAADLANYLEQNALSNTIKEPDCKSLDLLEIPSRNYGLRAIHETCSLYEAMQGFQNENTEVLYVSGKSGERFGEVKGILTLPAIENYYRPSEFQHAMD